MLECSTPNTYNYSESKHYHFRMKILVCTHVIFFCYLFLCLSKMVFKKKNIILFLNLIFIFRIVNLFNVHCIFVLNDIHMEEVVTKEKVTLAARLYQFKKQTRNITTFGISILRVISLNQNANYSYNSEYI